MVRLLELGKDVGEMVEEGGLCSADGGRLLSLKEGSKIKKRGKEGGEECWSVRYLEE